MLLLQILLFSQVIKLVLVLCTEGASKKLYLATPVTLSREILSMYIQYRREEGFKNAVNQTSATI